jgi:hypothetical protein
MSATPSIIVSRFDRCVSEWPIATLNEVLAQLRSGLTLPIGVVSVNHVRPGQSSRQQDESNAESVALLSRAERIKQEALL